MDLGEREAANLLGVSEKTVRRWIRSGGLPAQRVHHQFRINRIELHEWALVHGHAASPHTLGGRPASLASALERGGVYRDVPGADREHVLAALVDVPSMPRGVNRQLLVELLSSRDAFVLSSVAHGIALPHPRDPVVLRGQESLAVLGFPERPVAYGAQSVSAVLLVLAPSIPVFLGLLGSVARVIADDRMRALLASPQSATAVVERVRFLENESIS